MAHIHNGYTGSLNSALRLRNLLAGSSDNITLNILRNNNYEINYFLDNTFSFYFSVPMIDYYDFDYSKLTSLKLLGLEKFKINVSKAPCKFAYSTFEDQYNKIVNMIKSSLSRKKSQFFFIKFGENVLSSIDHAPGEVWLPNYIKSQPDYKNYEKYRFKFLSPTFYIEYINQVKRGNYVLQDILNLIIENDPNSIIILLGDHGSLSIASILSNEAIYFAQNYFELKTIANSFFNVICAIRFPDNGTNKQKKELLSNVNIFRYIFSYLSGKNIPFTDNISITATQLIMIKDAQTISPIPIDQYINNHKISPWYYKDKENSCFGRRKDEVEEIKNK